MRFCLRKSIHQGTGVCVGLDPDLTRFPEEFRQYTPLDAIVSFLHEIISITKPYTDVYKLQKAFFDLHCIDALPLTINHIRKEHPDAAIIVDAKLSDVSHTMQAYAQYYFDKLDVDGLVVNPYFGDDVFQALKPYKDRGILTVIRSSNEGAKAIQDVSLQLNDKKVLFWEYILKKTMQDWNENENIIPILSYHAATQNIRSSLHNDTIIFYAGYGAQGGSLNHLPELVNRYGFGVLVNSSRGILYPYDKADNNWRNHVSTEIETLTNLVAESKNVRS